MVSVSSRLCSSSPAGIVSATLTCGARFAAQLAQSVASNCPRSLLSWGKNIPICAKSNWLIAISASPCSPTRMSWVRHTRLLLLPAVRGHIKLLRIQISGELGGIGKSPSPLLAAILHSLQRPRPDHLFVATQLAIDSEGWWRKVSRAHRASTDVAAHCQ